MCSTHLDSKVLRVLAEDWCILWFCSAFLLRMLMSRETRHSTTSILRRLYNHRQQENTMCLLEILPKVINKITDTYQDIVVCCIRKFFERVHHRRDHHNEVGDCCIHGNFPLCHLRSSPCKEKTLTTDSIHRPLHRNSLIL